MRGMDSITLEQAAELMGETVDAIRRRITDGHLEPLHSVDELADAFGVSASTVRDLCARHEWPHVQLGRRIRFTDEHVREILEIHTVRISDEARRVASMMARGMTRRGAEYHARRGR